ncbi:unnamed protein product, partial [Polarella glacialis]
ATYRTNAAQRAMIGKSFGGSAVAHAMLDTACAPLFRYYLLGSPSLSWDEGAFFRLEEETHRSRDPLAAAVFVSAGGLEGPSKVEELRRFESLLKSRASPDLTVTVDIVPGEDHGSLSYPFACRALGWLSGQLSAG